MAWFGYKVHLTETCALETTEDAQARALPQLIVQVQTTVANVQDVDMTATIQEDLAQRDLLPEDQIVDTGYVDAVLTNTPRGKTRQSNFTRLALHPALPEQDAA